jgi:hypothetical protein
MDRGPLGMNGRIREAEWKASWCRNTTVPGDEWKVSWQMRGRAPGVGMPMYVPGDERKVPGRDGSVPGDEGMVSGLLRGRAHGVGRLVCLGMNERCPGR